MCFFDASRPAHDRRNTGVLKQAGFGAIRYGASRARARKGFRQPHNGVRLVHMQSGGRCQPLEIDCRVWLDTLHFGQQRGGEILDFLIQFFNLEGCNDGSSLVLVWFEVFISSLDEIGKAT